MEGKFWGSLFWVLSGPDWADQLSPFYVLVSGACREHWGCGRVACSTSHPRLVHVPFVIAFYQYLAVRKTDS